MNDPALIRERFEKAVQAIVDAGACPMQPTTVIDLSGDDAGASSASAAAIRRCSA